MKIKFLKSGEINPSDLKAGDWFAAIDGHCVGIVEQSSYVIIFHRNCLTPQRGVIANLRSFPIRRVTFELVEVP